MSLIALVVGIKYDEVQQFVSDHTREGKRKLFAAIETAGHTPSYAAPSLFRMKNDTFMMMINHEYDVSGKDAADITKATVNARKELHTIMDALRATGSPWQDATCVWIVLKNVPKVSLPTGLNDRNLSRYRWGYPAGHSLGQQPAV